jgi:predicted RNase H-like HicB family nuclease
MAAIHQPTPAAPVSLPAVAPYSAALNGEYEVVLMKTADGYAVFCPALSGCISQGNTEAEALDNIVECILLWLEVDIKQMEVRKAEMLADGERYGFRTTIAKVRLPESELAPMPD